MSRMGRASPQDRRDERGFGLIEVLVALLVLGLGLLGLAGLQISALRASHAAYQYTVADIMARDAMERLWLAHSLSPSNWPSHIDEVDGEWLEHWRFRPDQASRVSLPDLSRAGIRCTPQGLCHIHVQWSEARFGPDAADGLDYWLRLPVLP